MNHLTKNIINNYLDNDLSYDDKKYVEEHISYCDVCKKEFNSYVKLHQILKTQTCESPKNLSTDAIYKKAVKHKKAEDNKDNIILYSILSIIFLVLSSIFVILRAIVKNNVPLTPDKKTNLYTNFEIIGELFKNFQFELNNNIIFLLLIILSATIIFLVYETYKKIKFLDKIKNEK